MKKYLLLSLAGVLIIMCNISSCSEESDDPCDGTAKPEIQVTVQAIVHVLDKDKNPIVDQQVNFWIYKEPCGADIKGKFEFSGPTNWQGLRWSTVVGYNLRNSEDKVWIDAHAVGLGNGSVSEDSELISYRYGDFIGTSTKIIDLYIYRDF